jgi:hypothetical protein
MYLLLQSSRDGHVQSFAGFNMLPDIMDHLSIQQWQSNLVSPACSQAEGQDDVVFNT